MGGVNPYVYAGNDPVNKVDPTGLLWTNQWSFPDASKGWGSFESGFWRAGTLMGRPHHAGLEIISQRWRATGGGFMWYPRKAYRELYGIGIEVSLGYTMFFMDKSDCAKLVDDLVARAPKAIRGTRSDLQQGMGRAMGLSAKNKFGKGHSDPNLGVGSFQQYLFAGGQGADVYKHIYGVAGAVLIGDHYIAGGISITPQPGARSARTGWALAQTQLDADIAQQSDPEHHDQAVAEVADDYAAIDIGKLMGQTINGDLASDQLRQNIFNRICDH